MGLSAGKIVAIEPRFARARYRPPDEPAAALRRASRPIHPWLHTGKIHKASPTIDTARAPGGGGPITFVA